VEEGVGRIKEKQNNTYHTGIKCTPEEAWDGNSEIVSRENGAEGISYLKGSTEKGLN
jgi:hypothetical protein